MQIKMEKRQALRFKKSYTAKFYLKDDPKQIFDISQIIDISKTGLKFFSYGQHKIGQCIILQIFLPHLYPQALVIESTVVGIEEVLKGKTCKVRVSFINLTPILIKELEMMEKVNNKTI